MAQQKNSEIEITLLMEKYQLFVFRTAIGFVHNQQDAEDITQEVFIRAYKNLDKFRGDSQHSTWLYRIAVNCSLNFLAKAKRRAFFGVDSSNLENIVESRGSGVNPARELELQEESQKVAKLIDTLPKRQRVAFILSKYNHLPQQEIAEIMGVSVGAVEQLLYRARNNLSKSVRK